MDTKNYGKGALKDKRDIRDFRLEVHLKRIGAPILPLTYDISDKVNGIKNQGSSSSCGGQAFSYYIEMLTRLRDNTQFQLSAKDVYSNVFVPGGGSYARDLLKRIQNYGIAQEKDISSYENGQPPSEQFMESVIPRTNDIDLDAKQRLIGAYLTFSSTDQTQVKQAIYTGNGAIIAVLGNDYCWTHLQDGIVSVPDNNSQCPWGHFLYLLGWEVKDGIPCYKFVNSWSLDWGINGFGYLPEGYLIKGLGYNEWTTVELPRDQWSNMQKMVSILKNLVELFTELIAKLKK